MSLQIRSTLKIILTKSQQFHSVPEILAGKRNLGELAVFQIKSNGEIGHSSLTIRRLDFGGAARIATSRREQKFVLKRNEPLECWWQTSGSGRTSGRPGVGCLQCIPEYAEQSSARIQFCQTSAFYFAGTVSAERFLMSTQTMRWSDASISFGSISFSCAWVGQ